jgi:AraC family transcriptional regulator
LSAIRHLHAAVSPGLYLRQRRLFVSLQSDTPPDLVEIEETTIGLLNELLASAYSHGRCRSSPDQRTRAVRQHRDVAFAARRVLNRTYRRALGLRGLAAAVGCSPFHLCRAFRDVTGSTIHAHLTTLRLRAALESLQDARDMTAVALDAGFSSHSHFTAAFRRSFGVTPSRALRATF